MSSLEIPQYDVRPPPFPTKLLETAIDSPRPIKIIVIGAGFSGTLAGVVFPRKIENIQLTIYDKNEDVGGTWLENRYPGVGCDVPSHAYQYTFESNTQWSGFYAPGPEILKYLKHVATKYGVYEYTKFNSAVRKAQWDDELGKWSLEIENVKSGKKILDTCDILISGVGILNQWKWPDIPGLHEFEGRLFHSANYDPTYDITNHKVALIGGGSSGIQILPHIQPVVKHVDHYMKGRTWIPPWGMGVGYLIDQGVKTLKTAPEDLKRYKEDPAQYIALRRGVEESLNEPFYATFKNSEDSKALWEYCEDNMREKLASRPDIYEALKPGFAPGCRRLTPGPGYLEALVKDNVDFIPTSIKKVLKNGIETEDGKFREVDTIICATGFDGVHKQHFPIIGKDGTNLGNLWENDIPEAYLSLCPQQMPNFFLFLGPNGGPGNGSNAPFLENACSYMVKAIKKIQREHIKSMVPKIEAIKDFTAQKDAFFEKTIFTTTCNAWWKHRNSPNGKIVSLWPGSALHGSSAFNDPRWEDYDYEYRSEMGGNRFAWLGNGVTVAQEKGLKTTWYLDEPMVTVDNPFKKSLEEPKAVVAEHVELITEKSESFKEITMENEKATGKRKFDEQGAETGLKSKKPSGRIKQSQ